VTGQLYDRWGETLLLGSVVTEPESEHSIFAKRIL
jgi:hypothetical protein